MCADGKCGGVLQLAAIAEGDQVNVYFGAPGVSRGIKLLSMRRDLHDADADARSEFRALVAGLAERMAESGGRKAVRIV
jgi:hypothetical protein